MDRSNLSQGRPLLSPPCTITVTTDASTEGWGGHTTVNNNSLLFSGLWSQTERRTCHINLLELRAIKLTLLRVAPHVKGQVVKLECDNTTAVSYLNKQGGTRSRTLCLEACQLHEWMLQNEVQATAVHRPGVDNTLADFLSRNRPDPNEWSLSPYACRQLFRRWGTPRIDLFASLQNHKLPLWFSRLPCPQATGTDAMAQTWTGWSVYAFPPKNLILRTLTKIRDDRVEDAIVVVPHWPKRGWFPLLLHMAVETPVMFRLEINLLSQVLQDKGRLYHPDLRSLQLTAWKLSGAPGRRQALAIKSLPLPWQQNGPQPVLSMMEDGLPMPPGANADSSTLYELL